MKLTKSEYIAPFFRFIVFDRALLEAPNSSVFTMMSRDCRYKSRKRGLGRWYPS